MGGMRRVVLMPMALGVLCLVCTACAGTLPPIGAAERPFSPASDEALLWERAAREHHKLSASLSVQRDPLLQDYLTAVARRLLPPHTSDAGVSIAVQVINNPALNAFAYPTGVIYVHSGLLARLENEAQLAAVLAHEIGHVIHRHAIQHLRQERNKDLWTRLAIVTTPLVLGPLLAPLGVAIGGGVNPAVLLQRPSVEDLLTAKALDTSFELAIRPAPSGRVDHLTALYTRTRPALALLAAVQGYDAALEEAADRFAVAALSRAGYDATEAERALALLHGVATSQAEQEPFWWGRPSTYVLRRQWIRAALAELKPADETNHPRMSQADIYQQRTRRLVRENAMAELKVGRTAEAMAQLGRVLRLHPQDPVAHFYVGKVYAAHASDAEALTKAVASYTRATQTDTSFAEAYLELALTYARLGEFERAAQASEVYVKLRGGRADLSSLSLRTLLHRGLPAAGPRHDWRP